MRDQCSALRINEAQTHKASQLLFPGLLVQQFLAEVKNSACDIQLVCILAVLPAKLVQPFPKSLLCYKESLNCEIRLRVALFKTGVVLGKQVQRPQDRTMMLLVHEHSLL